MNQKAEELELENTHFVTPHGLDEEEHYTTAYELAILADYGLNMEKFKQIVGTTSYTVTINGYAKALHNTNELLGSLDGVYGVKTGFTNGANRCLVTASKRGDMDVICVVLGADTKKFRTQDSVKLIEYVFENYKIVNIHEKVQKEFNEWKISDGKDIVIIKGQKDTPKIQLEEMKLQEIPIEIEKEEQIQVIIESCDTIEAPIEQGETIGKCKVMVGEDRIEELNITVSEKVEKKNILDYFIQLWTHYFDYIEKGISF